MEHTKTFRYKVTYFVQVCPKAAMVPLLGCGTRGPTFLSSNQHSHTASVTPDTTHTRYCGSYECEPIVVTSCHGITRDQRPRCRLGSAQCWVSSRCSELWPASSNFSHTFPSPLHFQTEFLVPRGFFRRSLLISPPLPVSRHIT